MTKIIPATTVHDSKKRANAKEPLDRRINQITPAIKVRPAQIGATHAKVSSTAYQNGLRFSIISPDHAIIPGLPRARQN
jgi:LPS O-antigen subunit length determinant protein (WzzB/FepE family)